MIAFDFSGKASLGIEKHSLIFVVVVNARELRPPPVPYSMKVTVKVPDYTPFVFNNTFSLTAQFSPCGRLCRAIGHLIVDADTDLARSVSKLFGVGQRTGDVEEAREMLQVMETKYDVKTVFGNEDQRECMDLQ